MVNALIILQILDSLLARAQVIGVLLSKVQSEGRDVTEDELKALSRADDEARIALEQAIQLSK